MKSNKLCKKINFFIKTKIIKEKIIILLFICFIFLFLLTYNKKPKLKKTIYSSYPELIKFDLIIFFAVNLLFFTCSL